MQTPEYDLFGDKVKPIPVGGYAAMPGSGPDGMTCKQCQFIYRKKHAKRTYIKCDLVKWTNGSATDIRAKSPACHRFSEQDKRSS